MKKIILGAAALLMAAAPAAADITVKLPDTKADTLYLMHHIAVEDMVKPRAQRPAPVVDTLLSVGGILKYDLDDAGLNRYELKLNPKGKTALIYAAPGENIAVIVTDTDKGEYVVTGTPLMDGISDILAGVNPELDKIMAAYQAKPRDTKAIEQAEDAVRAFVKDYMKKNPTNPASLYAMRFLDDDDFMNAYENLSPEVKANTLFLTVEQQKKSIERSQAAEKKMQALQQGHAPAPNFTLKNLEGKDVSLSDFRGKWVIIDFWGSWCGWCIKGMPKLKDAYEQYQPELEVIGVDCNEPEANWRRGVEKYKLPWVNVYNPEGTDVLSNYGVQGFPTKVIVNPEGNIADIVVGEDPAFYDKLARLINEK